MMSRIMQVDTRCGPGKRADCRDAVKALITIKMVQVEITPEWGHNRPDMQDDADPGYLLITFFTY